MKGTTGAIYKTFECCDNGDFCNVDSGHWKYDWIYTGVLIGFLLALVALALCGSHIMQLSIVN